MDTSNPSILSLPNDILNIIINMSANYNCIITCKKLYNLILQNSKICTCCKKIINMYDNVLWITYLDDEMCHGYYKDIETYKLVKRMLQRNYKFLKKITRQCFTICTHAIKQNIKAFLLITNPTEAICIYFINCFYKGQPIIKEYNHYIDKLTPLDKKYTKLKFGKKYKTIFDCVPYQTENICLEIIRHNPKLLKYVTNQTENICLEAVKRRGRSLKHIQNQTEQICLKAIKNDSSALRYVINQTDELCLEAVKKNPNELHYVINKTDEICLEAIKKNPYCIRFIKHQEKYEKIILDKFEEDPDLIRYIENPSDSMVMKALNENISNLRYITNPPENLCIDIIQKNGMALQYVEHQTNKMCFAAIKQNAKSFCFIRNPTEQMYIEAYKMDNQILDNL